MTIRAILANGNEVEIPSYALNYVIVNKKISAFLRTDGWVTIGADKIRKQQLGSLCLIGPGERDTDDLLKRSKP